MKALILQLLLLMSGFVYGQDASLRELVEAERAFASRAKESSTKEAFIGFMSDSGLVFQKEPVNGKAFWQSAEAGPDLLSWEPVFARIAASGDLGYTTGPWLFRQDRKDTNAVAAGYYVSLWKKETTGWKVILDIGTSFPGNAMRTEITTFAGSQYPLSKKTTKVDLQELLTKEKEFIGAQETQGLQTYPPYLKDSARIYRPGKFPAITRDEQKRWFAETDKIFKYIVSGGGIASSGDLGYIYGKAEITISGNGDPRVVQAHYLRIWERDRAGNWKIALDLVTPAR